MRPDAPGDLQPVPQDRPPQPGPLQPYFSRPPEHPPVDSGYAQRHHVALGQRWTLSRLSLG